MYHIHDSGILDRAKDLPTSWKYANEDIRLKKQFEGQPDKPLGFAKSRGKRGVKIGPNETKVINCMAKAKCHGMSVNVLVEPCEVSKLPPGMEVQYSYTDIAAGSSKVSVSVKNNTDRTITIQKGTKIRSIFCANKVPKILNQAIKVSKLEKDIENSKQTNKANANSTQSPNSDERQPQSNSEKVDWILQKLDLSGMSQWPMDLQAKAKDLLVAYSDIFSKTDMDMGTTKLVKHHMDLTDYTPFKERYRRMPPHLYDEVRAYLKEMLDLSAIRKSQSPWSSPIVLVRKKDGKLRFCIDLRKLNQRTVRDNYSLPNIDHMLKQLEGAQWFCTLDLKSGYWQVELTEESKPYTAFACGPLGFFECEKMPFGASNTPATFQRLMENYLGDLNLR